MTGPSARQNSGPDVPEKPYSPREFLRARHPERFSDSVTEVRPALDRLLLEYHLDTLSTRGQEKDFERFALRLAERCVCPNLRPQTGPTGGGDSKVDSETYPVADELSLFWFLGLGREASTERWAFAFSTKKDWRPKVRSDVAKIAATGRGYTKAFFVTNQNVPDRDRAALEDELCKAHGLDVRIFDRTWILDRIFEGGHEDLAVDELRIMTSILKSIEKGPLDRQREQDLGELEQRIVEASRNGNYGFQVVDDCLEVAVLARELDRPRAEVDGLFNRAQRLADKYGTLHQRLVSTYEYAWTAHWWYEDYKLFEEQYSAVENYVLGTHNPYHLELLNTIWTLLHSLVSSGVFTPVTARMESRTVTLQAELRRLSEDVNRPTAALQARALGLQMRLLTSASDLDPVLCDIQDVIRQIDGMVGFPLRPLVQVLTELGPSLSRFPTYDDLFETIVEVTSRRDGEVSAARMLATRGSQHLEADRPYEAIRSLGRALVRLYKDESRQDIVHALYLCSKAYYDVGLYWAARGAAVTAASIAMNEFHAYEIVNSLQRACLDRAKWLELRLGRVFQALAWHEVDQAVRGVLIDQGEVADSDPGETEAEYMFDRILGLLFLKSELQQLESMAALPDVLYSLQLPHATLALLYALGYEEVIPGLLEPPHDSGALYDYFSKWRDQPISNDLPDTPVIYETAMITLSSNVLGCRVKVESVNASPCIELAESILAAIESCLSTGLDLLIAREPFLSIRVQASEAGGDSFAFEWRDQTGRPHLEVHCSSFDPQSMGAETYAQVKDKLTKLVLKVLARICLMENVEQVTTRLFQDELALDRSINFTSSFHVVGIVLGSNAKTSVSDWSTLGTRTFTLKRSAVWDSANRQSRSGSNEMRSGAVPVHNEAPADVPDVRSIKHNQVETVSLIRLSLWDEAGWSGTGFIQYPEQPPILALIFSNMEAANQIFSGWSSELGPHDPEEKLRVTIIRGINRSNPFAYRVVIGVNPIRGSSRPDVKYTQVISRMKAMDPATDRNLNKFLKGYGEIRMYILAPALLVKNSLVPASASHLVKHDLYVREAWEIGRHDPDATGILPTDDPIIPLDNPNAPVRELLQWIRESRSSDI